VKLNPNRSSQETSKPSSCTLARIIGIIKFKHVLQEAFLKVLFVSSGGSGLKGPRKRQVN
jgi:hypothetical protein